MNTKREHPSKTFCLQPGERCGKLLSFLLVILSVLPLAAQTNPPAPPSPNSLPGTILGYFSSFDTNLVTFTQNRFDLWTGASSVQGAVNPLVNDLGLSYDILRPTGATNATTHLALDLENTIRNSGVAGSVVSEQGGLGLNVIVYDVKLTLYGNGGYYLDPREPHKAFAEIGLRAKKAIGQHFYLGVGLGTQLPHSRQIYSAFAGATF